MNREELALKLKALGVPDREYNLYGDKKIDTIMLEHINDVFGLWKTYYIGDYGAESDERHFTTEHEACEHIYNKFAHMYKK